MVLAVAALALQCGLAVEANILDAIVQVESRGNPYALAVNGEVELVRKPRNLADAVRMARWLGSHGYNFDAGLAQINSANLRWLGLSVEDVFDPCTNLRAASRVLHACYRRAFERQGEGPGAVLAALSCYHTGGFTRGVANGYVAAVRAKAGGPLVIQSQDERGAEGGVCWAGRMRKARPSLGRESSDPPAEARPDVFGEPLADAFGQER